MSAYTLTWFILLRTALAVPNSQRPLHDVDVEKARELPKWSALPIRPARWYDMGHTINISIGNPPQEIPVYLDISSADSWIVPDTLSNKPCPSSPSFHTNLSSTYLASPKTVDFTNDWIWGRGTMVFDTISYGTLPAPFQPFIVANKRDGGAGGFNGCPMAGFVGLAPSSQKKSVLNKPSHFERMVDMGLLERDLLALRLKEPAELSLGRMNPDLYKGEFTKIPLVQNRKGTWQTTASHLIVENGVLGEPGLRYELRNESATFTTAWPVIHVPWGVFQGLMTTLGFDDVVWLVPSVRCEKRDSMPDVTFNLAGQNITITAYDYTEFWDGLPDGPRCASLFVAREPREKHSNEVVLGWSFLRAFYSVFDLGEGVAKFAPLS